MTKKTLLHFPSFTILRMFGTKFRRFRTNCQKFSRFQENLGVLGVLTKFQDNLEIQEISEIAGDFFRGGEVGVQFLLKK